MPQQAITQEALFLPLLRFVERHGGSVHRQDHDVLWRLAWELKLSREEFERVTDNGRWQWKATVEYCRQKLIDYWEALEPGDSDGEWRLTAMGRQLASNPPEYMERHYDRWRTARGRSVPSDRGGRATKEIAAKARSRTSTNLRAVRQQRANSDRARRAA